MATLESEARRFRLFTTAVAVTAAVGLAIRLLAAPMSQLGFSVSMGTVLSLFLLPLLVPTRISLRVGQWAFCLIVYFGTTFAMALNGGMQSPGSILITVVAIGVLLVLRPKSLSVAIFLAVLPGLLLILFRWLGLTGAPYTDNPAFYHFMRALWTIFSLVTLGYLAWRYIADVRTSREVLIEKSERDQLTGLANRHAIDEMMLREIRSARRRQSTLSLILFDIDHFKKFNDTNGHNAGDDCLRRVAAEASHCVRRPSDLLGRWGGEEFIVVAPDTPQPGALHIAEEIRRSIRGLDIPYDLQATADSDKRLTASFGVYTAQGADIPEPLAFIEQVDRALYTAKQSGRNQVRFYSD